MNENFEKGEYFNDYIKDNNGTEGLEEKNIGSQGYNDEGNVNIQDGGKGKKKDKKKGDGETSGKDDGQEPQQERLPRALAADPAIASGSLANGIKYYIATNPTETGLAEFVLVRKTPYITDRDSTIALSRELIADLGRFKGQSTKDFLAGNGGYAVPTSAVLSDGNISVQDDAVIYRFGTLPVGARSTLIDSTLLMIFDIVERAQNSGRLPAGYSTSDNAVIISGDIDKSALLTKLNNFSMMVEKISIPGGEPVEYEWQPRDSIICTIDTMRTGQAAFLTVSYASARTPERYMSTSLPEVSYHYAEILGIMLRKRIVTEMRDADIPLAKLSCDYTPTAETSGDEKYEISLCVPADQVTEACRVIASIIAGIDNYGIKIQGFAAARREYLTNLYVASQRTVIPNDDYVRKCLAAFLYGATPVTDYERWSFLGKGVVDSASTHYFNNYAAKLLSGDRNLSIGLRTSKPAAVSEDEMTGVFREICGGERYVAENRVYFVNPDDTLSFGRPEVKVKVKTERKDGISGGTRWEFSNGITVIYKRMDTQGLFYYDLVVRGGYSSLDGLSKGEGAFLNDMLKIYDVGGLKGENFQNFMQTNGISVSTEVTVSDMSIYGVALRPSLHLLMKVLTTYTNTGTIDRTLFDYYRRSELLRLDADKGSRDAKNAIIDSLLSPSYRYYSDKMVSGLRDDLPDLAEAFFNTQFSRLNDGVFVIVGDMNEDLMKKLLQKYIGGFRTSGTYLMRNRINYSTVSGWSTLIWEGESPSIDLALSAAYPFTAENFMTSRVTEFAVRDALNRAMTGSGSTAQVKLDMFSYPQERAVLLMTVENVTLDALPAGEDHIGEVALLFRLREALANFEVSAADLALYKAMVKNEYKSRQKDPRYWLYMVQVRYSAIKDLNAKYSEKIDSVTAEDVAALFSALNAGGKVEFIVR